MNSFCLNSLNVFPSSQSRVPLGHGLKIQTPRTAHGDPDPVYLRLAWDSVFTRPLGATHPQERLVNSAPRD